MATVRDKDTVYREMVQLSEAMPGETEAQRFVAFVNTPAGTQKYAEYQDAPFAERPKPTPPPAPPSAAWSVVESKATALLATDATLSHAAAVARVCHEHPELVEADRRAAATR